MKPKTKNLEIEREVENFLSIFLEETFKNVKIHTIEGGQQVPGVELDVVKPFETKLLDLVKKAEARCLMDVYQKAVKFAEDKGKSYEELSDFYDRTILGKLADLTAPTRLKEKP